MYPISFNTYYFALSLCGSALLRSTNWNKATVEIINSSQSSVEFHYSMILIGF